MPSRCVGRTGGVQQVDVAAEADPAQLPRDARARRRWRDLAAPKQHKYSFRQPYQDSDTATTAAAFCTACTASKAGEGCHLAAQQPVDQRALAHIGKAHLQVAADQQVSRPLKHRMRGCVKDPRRYALLTTAALRARGCSPRRSRASLMPPPAPTAALATLQQHNPHRLASNTQGARKTRYKITHVHRP